MNSIRTTVELPTVVLEHIRMRIGRSDSLKDFITRACINQLENEFSDFEVRDALEREVQDALFVSS